MITRYRPDISSEEMRIAKVFKHIFIKWIGSASQFDIPLGMPGYFPRKISVQKVRAWRTFRREALFPIWKLENGSFHLVSFKKTDEVLSIGKRDFRSICGYIKPSVSESTLLKAFFKMSLIAVHGHITDYKFRFPYEDLGDYYLLDAKRMSPKGTLGRGKDRRKGSHLKK
jgi:hypothetical protein